MTSSRSRRDQHPHHRHPADRAWRRVHMQHDGYVHSTTPGVYLDDDDETAQPHQRQVEPHRTRSKSCFMRASWERDDCGAGSYGYKVAGTLIDPATGLQSVNGVPYAVNPSVGNANAPAQQRLCQRPCHRHSGHRRALHQRLGLRALRAHRRDLRLGLDRLRLRSGGAEVDHRLHPFPRPPQRRQRPELGDLPGAGRGLRLRLSRSPTPSTARSPRSCSSLRSRTSASSGSSVCSACTTTSRRAIPAGDQPRHPIAELHRDRPACRPTPTPPTRRRPTSSSPTSCG